MKTILIVLLSVLFSLQVYPQKSIEHHPAQAKAISKTRLNLNNISAQFFNDGISDNFDLSNPGFVFPRGTGKTAVYCSGLLWGGKKPGDPQPRVGGSAYRSGLQPGKIISPGFAEDPNLAKNRIYRIRKDVYPGGPQIDLSIESVDESLPEQVIRQQYELDWLQWPAQDGAPYQDLNGNSAYDPAIDIPGIRGAAQTVWFVANDLNPANTTFLYGALPLGIEAQVTLWNYTENEQLSNMYFRKYILINKSGGAINDMYISQWSDPDVGNSIDDYAGCDTSRNFGFAFNAVPKDALYDYTAPAVAFDLLQGPVVAGIPGQDRNKNGIDDGAEYAIFKGRKKGPGFINLPMTAFYYFSRGDASVTDPVQGAIEGSSQFYNFFQGKIGLTGQYFTTPTNQPTTYGLSRDPVSNTGWIDGQLLPPGDRRLGLSAGAFNFAANDTQEVIIAEIVAGGKSAFNALKVLRYYDASAQRLYDSLFVVPVLPLPPAPGVARNYSTTNINLNWESNAQQVESFNSMGFAFEGYNVYQLHSDIPSIQNAVKIATFDKVNAVTQISGEIMNPATGYPATGTVQNGTNSGLQRSLQISADYIDNYPLLKGRAYAYAVTAYAYNPIGTPKSTETLLRVFWITFLDSIPGIRYNSPLLVSHTNGIGNPSVTAIVYDPALLTGHNYRITFSDTSQGSIKWNLTDMTTMQTLISKKAPADTFYLVHGVNVKVESGPTGVTGWSIPSGTRRFTWVNADGFGLEGFNGTIGNARDHWFSGSTLPLDSLKNVLIKLAATDTGGIVVTGNPNISFAYRYLRRATSAAADPSFVPFIVHPTAGYAYQDFKKNFPFSAWDMEANPPRRLAVGYLENNVPLGLVDGKYWPPYNGDAARQNVDANGPREWFLFLIITILQFLTPL